VRGFATEFAALEHEDLAAEFVQLERDGESDHASADDDCVPTLHIKIVAKRRERCDVSE
jgi:hypothetical protein